MANGNWRVALPALAVFEAAARHLNFSAAARELGTTQPAVSHHVSWLETELRCRLFRRLHRGVSLTPEGVILFEAIATSRRTIERAQAEIRSLGGRRLITIATDYGFAGEWLIPQLASLSLSIPDIEVRVVASQAAVDPRAEAADCAVLLGAGDWPGCSNTLLFPETVFAVASPALLDRHPPIRTIADLARLRLLHLESHDRSPWLTWNGWYAAQGEIFHPREGDFFFNTYSMVQQAAIAGQGVALGWHPLIDLAIARRMLVRVLSAPVQTDQGYYLVEAEARPAQIAFARFRTWLLDACATLSAEPPGH